MFKIETQFVLNFLLLSFLVCVKVKGEHFVLVHGASHGAWCWYKVSNTLKSAGHNVTALDLGASGINPKQVQEIGSISEYYEPLITFMDSLPSNEKVILVGHSYGGIPISVAMEKFPDKISLAVFVAAAVLTENFNITAHDQKGTDDLMDTQITFFDGPNNLIGSVLLGPKFLASHFYRLSPPEDLTLALSLMRPHPMFKVNEELLNETRVTQERNGRVPKVFVISNGYNVELQNMIIENTGPYVEVRGIDGSDHMIMFSKPKILSSYLLKIAHKQKQGQNYASI